MLTKVWLRSLRKSMNNMNKWKTVARDFNSPLIRHYIAVKGVARSLEELGVRGIDVGIISEKNNIKYIIQGFSAWRATHRYLIKEIEKDIYFVDKLIDKIERMADDFTTWTKNNILNLDLVKLNQKKLIYIYKQFIDRQSLLYTYGLLIPTLDFDKFSYVESNLKKILEKKLSLDQHEEYYKVLTYPVDKSFAEDQEENLLKLMARFFNPVWAEDIKSKDLTRIKKDYPEFYQGLKKHTQKHNWVYYTYIGPAFKETNFLEFIRDYLSQGVNPNKKLEDMIKKREEMKILRDRYIENLDANDFEKMILRLAGKIVWAKPRRKDYQSRLEYYFEKLLLEIAKRLTLSLNQVRTIPPNLIQKAFDSGIKEDFLNNLEKFHIYLPGDGSAVLLSGKKALDFCANNFKEDEINFENIKEIKGTTSYPGYAKGVVKIINVPEEMIKMEEGDILVSFATTPNIVPAIKKAAAIVTNEGGLTCHASIVSRELEIPCVTGTKIAAEVLKDGDRVEVDANKGVIKIIK